MTKPEENCEDNGQTVSVKILSCSYRTALESHFSFIWTVAAVNAIIYFVRCSSLDGTLKFYFAELYYSITLR